MVRALREGTIWSAAGIGRVQFFVNPLAVTMLGHVRVGLEDNLYRDTAKTRPASNAGLVKRIAVINQLRPRLDAPRCTIAWSGGFGDLGDAVMAVSTRAFRPVSAVGGNRPML
ncbi:MAG: 3-keto-5-aminohexanoate cleavage protein [Thermoguttaceae bacterium]|jgi:hypothetical protein